MVTPIVNIEQFNQNEIALTPEKKETIKGIVVHKVGHAVVAWAQGIPLMRIDLYVEGGKQSGSTIYNSLENVTPQMQGICITAGLAGELILLGEEYVRNSGFKGLKSDSAWLNRLGFTNQEQKAELLKNALGILNENLDLYKDWTSRLAETMEIAATSGQEKMQITRERMESMGILDYYSSSATPTTSIKN